MSARVVVRIPLAHAAGDLAPGSLCATRVALWRRHVLFANRRRVWVVDAHEHCWGTGGGEDTGTRVTNTQENGREEVEVVEEEEQAVLTGVRTLTPVHVDSTAREVPLGLCQHGSDIQSLARSRTHPDGTVHVATVDSTGAGCRAVLRHEDLGVVGVNEWRLNRCGDGAVVSEMGWAGVALHPTEPQQTVLAHQFARQICVFDGETVVRSFGALQDISGLAFMNAQIVALEENHMSVWDPRMRERQGCIQRVEPANAALTALACGENEVAVGGVDRMVYLYDTRRWGLRSHWRNVLKFEITSLNFVNGATHTLLVGGLGNELLCGQMREGKARSQERQYGFLADNLWLGVGKDPESDAAAGVTGAGSLYIVPRCNPDLPT